MEELSHVGMTNCWICGEGAEIVINKQLRKTLNMNLGSAPDIICSDCEAKSKDNDGIWVISIKDGDEPSSDNELWNPYRTGGLILLKKEALRNAFEAWKVSEKMVKLIDKHIYFYLSNAQWEALGLPEIGGNNE